MNAARLALGTALLLCQPLFAQPFVQGPVTVYDYEVLERREQPRENFVQGLEIHGDTLYMGTGQYGSSHLREYHFPTMELQRDHALPASLFGEGVTVLGKRIYQLTWQSRIGLIYDADTLEKTGQWTLNTEGWGLTNNGESLIYSDGSQYLYFLSPDTLQLERTLAVNLSGRPLSRLNELEWIDGEVWANVYGSNQLVRIAPDSGAVTSIVDLRGLLPDEDRREDTDVLNGIAYDRERQALWVTGKRWPWLFRITTRPRNNATSTQSR
jgi:glutamine cyclotransferase